MSYTSRKLNSGYRYGVRIPPVADGQSLLAYLLANFRHSDEATWRQRIDTGEISVEGQVIDADVDVRAGQYVVWARPPWIEPDAPENFEVVFEDEDLLGVSKPSGLPTLPGANFLERTLINLVQKTLPTAVPMHRLDRGTSGLVLFAKTKVASRAIQNQWQAVPSKVEKTYRALAAGVIVEDELRIYTPIGFVADPVVGLLASADPDGKSARSHLRVLERRAATTLVEVRIDSGRAHQIRIHLGATGHPLVDDPVYGIGGRRAPLSAARPSAIGYFLHAHRLALSHPRTAEPVSLIAPLPAELEVGTKPHGSG